MDLRSFIKSKAQIQRAKDLVAQGLLCYQPFLFAPDLETGVGYEFVTSQENVGRVYWPTAPPELAARPALRRLLVPEHLREEFARANERLRFTYDGFVEEICRRMGNVSEMSFADVGCSSAYFPVSFLLRGAERAVGYDREDYSDVFTLLNDILGADAVFVHKPYLGTNGTIPGCEPCDVAVSMMVLCHLSDTLRHLAFLGSIARRAIFVWTLVAPDDDYCIRFGQPNKYYQADEFPLCFDNMVRPSAKLLRKSLELMGFTELHELHLGPEAVPEYFYDTPNLAILALRSSS